MARYVKFFGLGGGVDGFITGSCNTVQATSYLQANGPEANINVAIIPKGTGAIVAACPDGTATGGNARGDGAIDFQNFRTSSTQVASGIRSVVLGGAKNQASGQYSLAFGENNQATDVGCIALGLGNTATARGAVAIGGYNAGNDSTGVGSSITGGESNIASSTYSTISGGQSNTASTNTHATVVGGYLNTASGGYSVAGGRSSQATGQDSVALGGTALASNSYASAFGSATASGRGSFAGGGFTDSNAPIASGAYSTAFGQFSQATGDKSFAVGGDGHIASGDSSVAMGRGNNASGSYSLSLGSQSQAYLYGQLAHSNVDQNIPNLQNSTLNSWKQDILASAATTVLSLDGTGTTNLIIPYGNNRLWAAKITATAFVSAVSGTTLVLGDSYMAEYTVLFKRVGGTSSVVGTNAGSVIADTNMISSAFTFAAGASQELAITFKAPTTANADTFRCVAKVELVEVAY